MAPEKSPNRTGRGRLAIAALVVVALVGVGAFAIGRLSAPVVSAPSTLSVEAGFARDMQVHHDQAVEMALIVRDRTDDPEIRSLAYDIATSQAQQSGQMYAWLNDWGLPQARPGATMEWMSAPTLDGSAGQGHEHGIPTTESADDAAAVAMPGMASDADLERLRNASGTDAEVLFLTLMLAHHRGGVDMADAVLDRSTHPLVTTLARAIVFAQSGEIDYMESLLAQRSS